LGIVAANPVNSLFCSGPGWPYIFYFWGGFGVLWVIFAWIFVDPNPQESRWISENEKKFLRSQATPQGKRPKTPWIALLKSAAVWAIAAAQFTFLFVNMFLSQYRS
jgi:hypothetical protein